MKRILVIDDEPNVRTVLTMLLEDDGYDVMSAEDGQKGMAMIDATSDVDLVISDLKMPGTDGMALLRGLKEQGRDIPVVMITAYGSIEKAVEAMKCGAADFVTKPFNKDVIRHVVHKLLTAEDLKKENDLLRQASPVPGVIAESRAMRDVLDLVAKVAAAPSAVLIMGESGCGKEVIARAIHERSALTRRSDFSVPFVSISCPAVPDTLIESELFGYRKGAFTGASQSFSGKISQARGGVLFLDEIAEIPLPTQAKLLRFLEEKAFEPLGSTMKMKVDARIICATNKDLEALVREGKFREDLYYRINTITIRVPPLRERREDILPLAGHFLSHYCETLGKRITEISPDAHAALLAYPWPGNVRELRNVMERAVVLATGRRVTAESFPAQMAGRFAAQAPAGKDGVLAERVPSYSRLEQMEKAMLLEVMRRNGGNVSSAARELGVSRDTLRYRIRKYDIMVG